MQTVELLGAPGNCATIDERMTSSGVAFGTSGVRGLVSAMSDAVCYAYTAGFLYYLNERGDFMSGDPRVAVAGDLRPSTGRIMAAVMRAVADAGAWPEHCGRLPSPALALYGLEQGIPTIMVTGSHIPHDRNGIKFTTAHGEIGKEDEAGIRRQTVVLPDIFDGAGMLRTNMPLGPVVTAAREAYVRRWLQAFPADFLHGLRLGLYQHSAVGRDLLREVYERLGAEVVCLGRSDAFIPVDTEALRPEDIALACEWARAYRLDAILSTDGDSDRPLLADEHGVWLRGDILGILCARYVQAEAVVTPISSNTAVKRCGWFPQVRRTRIGSPYVIAEMQRLLAAGAARVVGYEANGGFLTASPFPAPTGILAPLPTRDPVIVHIACLGFARQAGMPLSQLATLLPQRVTVSDRLQEIPRQVMEALLAQLTHGETELFGAIAHRDTTDGLRLTFPNDEILHLRPSGNAPELRCYVEAATANRAHTLLSQSLTQVAHHCRRLTES